MNIFFVDECPIKSAQQLSNKHVVKMILETAQLLCTIFPNGAAPYKLTHVNHPSAIWVRRSLANYEWLVNHGLALCSEYTHRYTKEHKSRSVIEWCWANHSKYIFLTKEFTPPPQCMPAEYKRENCVEAYQRYYRGEKQSFAKWTNRDVPNWFLENNEVFDNRWESKRV